HLADRVVRGRRLQERVADAPTDALRIGRGEDAMRRARTRPDVRYVTGAECRQIDGSEDGKHACDPVLGDPRDLGVLLRTEPDAPVAFFDTQRSKRSRLRHREITDTDRDAHAET